MKKLFVICYLMCCLTAINAQPLPPHVEFSELGMSFDIPSGWTGQLSENMVILGHNTIPGLMVLSENQSNSALELKQEAMQGYVDNGIQLRAMGDFSIKNNDRVEGMYEGTFNGAEVICYAIGLINHLGKGMNIMILTEKSKFNQQHKTAANQLASSVRFFQAKESPNTIRWKNHLVGKKIKYMKTSGGSDYSGGYSGTSSSWEVNLCHNGRFYLYANSHSSFDGSGGFGYSNGNRQREGRYSIYSEGNYSALVLYHDDGTSSEYELTSSERNHTLLDGTRHFVVASEICQ
jgi:hypothetical protein